MLLSVMGHYLCLPPGHQIVLGMAHHMLLAVMGQYNFWYWVALFWGDGSPNVVFSDGSLFMSAAGSPNFFGDGSPHHAACGDWSI